MSKTIWNKITPIQYNTLYLILLVLIICLIFICSCQFKPKETFTGETSNSQEPTISLCIPCYPPDTQELDKLMDSVRKLTVKPDQIIVGHSEMTKIDAKRLEDKFSDLSIEVVATEKKQYAAANRNMAAEQNKCDYISFMDSDDEMLPFRFQVLKKTIKKYQPKAILHSFYDKKLPEQATQEIKEEVNGVKIYDILERTKTLHITDYKVHHGHITVHKDTFQNVKQDTSEKYRRGQDSKYVRDIVKFYGKKKDTMIFLDIPLSVYYP